ncbi:MAG: hypothetical protein IKR90_07315 [Clostridia bacterium]|nr:hypothetical protein [Clostridia bacterium]
MKKILAILLALTMVFAFVACGSKTTDESTTEATEATNEDVTEAASEDATEAASEDATEAASEDATEAPSEDASEEASESETETTAADEGLNSTDPAEVVAFYNAARKATKPAPKGNQTMALVGDISGDGAIGAFAGPLTSAANSALSKNSKETDWIPAADHADIKPEDVTSAKATTKDGVTTIELKFKDQTDGPNGDSNNGGAVARGVGTLGSIDGALNELGAEISEGKDTVKLTYTDAYLKATVKDGKITGGTWHYRVNILVGNAKAKLSILSANLRNLKATVDYKVVI